MVGGATSGVRGLAMRIRWSSILIALLGVVVATSCIHHRAPSSPCMYDEGAVGDSAGHIKYVHVPADSTCKRT